MTNGSIEKNAKLKLLKSGDFTCQQIKGRWYAQDSKFHMSLVDVVGLGRADSQSVEDYIEKMTQLKESVDEALADAKEFLMMLQK